MKGDDRVRHCRQCDRSVYNVATMTESEVEAMIRRTEGRFCARVYRRADGRIVTVDCPRPATVRRKRTLMVTAVFGIATMISAGCMGSTGGSSSVGGSSAPPTRNAKP